MSRKALVLLVCCCDFRDGAERLIPSKSLGNAVIRAFPGLFRILRMCAPRRAAAVVRPRERKKSADRRRRILISRLLIIRASVPRRKSPFPAYFKGFPAVSPLIPPYPAFLKYPVSPQLPAEPPAKLRLPAPTAALRILSPRQRRRDISTLRPTAVMTTRAGTAEEVFWKTRRSSTPETSIWKPRRLTRPLRRWQRWRRSRAAIWRAAP